jgi:hypothetical protein
MYNNSKLRVFINLDDLPKVEAGFIANSVFIDIYKKILLKGGDILLMASYIGRSRRTVKKKLKHIIKYNNESRRWHMITSESYEVVKIENVEDLEQKLKNNILVYWG